jgi:hypothetical protein
MAKAVQRPDTITARVVPVPDSWVGPTRPDALVDLGQIFVKIGTDGLSQHTLPRRFRYYSREAGSLRGTVVAPYSAVVGKSLPEIMHAMSASLIMGLISAGVSSAAVVTLVIEHPREDIAFPAHVPHPWRPSTLFEASVVSKSDPTLHVPVDWWTNDDGRSQPLASALATALRADQPCPTYVRLWAFSQDTRRIMIMREMAERA